MILNLSRRSFVAGTAALSAMPMIGCSPGASDGENSITPTDVKATEAATGPAPVPTNPLVKNRADAQIFRHSDGNYYLTGSVPEYDRLILRRSKTLAGLATAEERVLWRHEKTGPMSGFLWAPEMHLIDGKWVMYFAAGPSGGGEDVFRIRTYAIVCDGNDPMTGEWKVLGKFQTPFDGFNLDSTVFEHRGTRYFCWAEREPGIETNSNIYLAPMKGALELATKPARLTVPTLDWEIRGFKVAEAPAFLVRNGRIFMTYSASATDDRYSLGMLTAAEDADLMDPKSWTKSPKPVFVSSEETSVYGPGHNSFTVDEQGRDVLVYHGRDYKAIKGDPLFDPNRHTRVQRIYYRADGTPDFGIPVGNGPVPDRYSPKSQPKAYLRHDGKLVSVGDGPIPASQFRLLPSAEGKDKVMLSPIGKPDRFLTVAPDDRAVIAQNDGSKDFAQRAALVRSEVDGGVQFALAAKPDHVLRIVEGTAVFATKQQGGGADEVFVIS